MKFQLIVNQCPYCGEKGTLTQDKYDYTRCTACGAGGEPPSESKRERQRIILACARNDDVSNPIMKVKSKKGGGKSGKKYGGKKEKMQRPSQKELYDRLCQK